MSTATASRERRRSRGTLASSLPPMLGGALPVMGHLLELRRRPVELLQRGRDLYGDMFRLQLPGVPRTVVMSGPQAQQRFFELSDDGVERRGVYKLMMSSFGHGIGHGIGGELPPEQLGFLRDALGEDRLGTYLRAFEQEVRSHFGQWGDEGVVDLVQTGRELASQATMSAAVPTTAASLAWTAILLNHNPTWIGRLRAEQRRVLGDRTDPSLEDLRAMHELGWTIKEALRMYPPIIMMARRVQNGFDFENHHVPAGCMVVTSPAIAHRIPEVFAHPNRFDPERFGPARREDERTPMAFIPFGADTPRGPGLTFAQLQLRTICSHLLRHFDLELIDPQYQPDYTRAPLTPRPPSRARYRRK